MDVSAFVGRIKKRILREYLDYIYSIPFVKRDSINLPDCLTYGCEIEVENIDIDKGDELVREFNKVDRSYGVYSRVDDASVSSEYTTPKCSDDIQTWNDMDEFINMLLSNGACLSQRTSGHVHYGTHLIDTVEKFANLVKVLCVFEPLIFRFGLGFDNFPMFFHKCAPVVDKATYTRLIDPYDADLFIKRITKKGLSDEEFCYAILKFMHCECYARPIFNFRNFDFLKIAGVDSYRRTVERIEAEGKDCFLALYPIGDHMEIRCFAGALDVRLWQNTVGLGSRIIYAVANGLVDMEYVNKEFSGYRRKRYEFYKGNIDYSAEKVLEVPWLYNDYLESYCDVDVESAMWFANTFYGLFAGDEVECEMFLKQYFKLFNANDGKSMLLKRP